MSKSLKDKQVHFDLMDVILLRSGDQHFGHMVTTMQLEKWRVLKFSGPLEWPYTPSPPHSAGQRLEHTYLDYGTVWGMWQVLNECNEMSLYRGDHTETFEIDYDPNEISYSELLDLFWKNHDPTAETTKQVCGLTQKGFPDTLVL